jgi:DNA primase
MQSEEIARLRTVRIAKILNLKDDGRKKFIRCPIHHERTPSFVIFPDNGFKCFGCGIHGQGAIDFVMKLMSCDFKKACEELKEYL